MARLAQITPLVPVSDIDRSVRFFVDTLGFKIGFQADGYAYLIRDCAAIRIIPAGEGVDLRDRKRQQACYIDVEGVEDLYRQLKPKLDMLPKGRVKKPFEQSYGQREFHVLDEDALLIMFGEPVSK